MNRSARPLLRLALALIVGPLSLAAVAERAIDETHAVDPDVTVSVSNVEGSIHVTGWSENEVRITGTLGDRVEGLEVRGNASRLEIEVRYPDSWHGRRSSPSELALSVPTGAQLIASGVSADITVENLNGRVRTESVSGDITINGSPEELNVSSVSGDVFLEVGTDSIKYSSVSGDLQLKGLAGDFSGNAVSGSMTITADMINRFEAETVSGDIDLNGPLAKNAQLEVNTLSGDVVLRLPRDLSARVRFETFSGDLYGDYDMPKLDNQKHLRFTLGDGDADLNLHTFSGSVELERGN